MAKDYKTGNDYKLYYMSAGSWSTPTWTEIKGVGDITLDPQKADIVVPERGSEDGHLHGHGDPVFGFQLFEDAGDTNVATLIDAIHSGAITTLAISRGAIATVGTKYWKLECVLFGSPLSASRNEPSSWDVQAMRHANSDNQLTRVTAS